MNMRRTHILVMEDDALVADAVRAHLEKSGYDVTVAADGEEGLRVFAAGTFDLLLVDYKMPKLTGLDVMRRLKARGPLPPLVLISGLGQDEVAVEGLKLGADDYVAKDGAGKCYELLPHTIERVLEKRRHEEVARDAQKEQARLLAELTGRLRELGCLYGTEKLFAEAAGAPDVVLKGVAGLLTHACRRGDLCCARIHVLGESHETPGFRDSPWMRTLHIREYGQPIGTLEIAYREEPPLGEEPFTPEEMELLHAIADRIGRFYERRHTEAQLMTIHDELRKLHRAVEQSASGIMITDPTGRIEYVNPKFTEMTGYSAEEALGQNPRILKSGEKDAGAYSELWATITAGRTWTGEFHNRRKSGELYWDHSTISPVTDATGRITHFVAVKEDFTDRTRAEYLREGVLRISAEIAGCQTEDQLCRAVVEAIRRHMDLDRCGLFLGEPDTVLFHGTYGTDMNGRTIPEREVIWDLKLNTDVIEQLSHAPYRSGFALGNPFENLPGDEGQSASLIALRQSGKLFGIISVDNRITRRPIGEVQLAHIAMLAEVIGNALQVARARAELEEFNQAMLHREDRVIELKDEVNALQAELGRPARYPPVWEERGVEGR